MKSIIGVMPRSGAGELLHGAVGLKSNKASSVYAATSLLCLPPKLSADRTSIACFSRRVWERLEARFFVAIRKVPSPRVGPILFGSSRTRIYFQVFPILIELDNSTFEDQQR